jgi:hypothetical protein
MIAAVGCGKKVDVRFMSWGTRLQKRRDNTDPGRISSFSIK